MGNAALSGRHSVPTYRHQLDFVSGYLSRVEFHGEYSFRIGVEYFSSYAD